VTDETIDKRLTAAGRMSIYTITVTKQQPITRMSTRHNGWFTPLSIHLELRICICIHYGTSSHHVV